MRVLFVDDDALNRRVVKDMLTVVNVDMDEAPGGEEGLDLIDSNDYDVVLMDLRMPGMNGLTAIEHIRARKDAKAGIPIIVVTADTSVDMRSKCLEAGADDAMTKPVAMKPLFRKIGKLVAMRSKSSAATA